MLLANSSPSLLFISITTGIALFVNTGLLLVSVSWWTPADKDIHHSAVSKCPALTPVIALHELYQSKDMHAGLKMVP